MMTFKQIAVQYGNTRAHTHTHTHTHTHVDRLSVTRRVMAHACMRAHTDSDAKKRDS